MDTAPQSTNPRPVKLNMKGARALFAQRQDEVFLHPRGTALENRYIELFTDQPPGRSYSGRLQTMETSNLSNQSTLSPATDDVKSQRPWLLYFSRNLHHFPSFALHLGAE